MGCVWSIPGTKFLPVCEPVKPENKFSASLIQWRARYRTDIPSAKETENRGVMGPRQVQGLRRILCGWKLHSLPAGRAALLQAPFGYFLHGPQADGWGHWG